jgi:cyclic dehypoxanthinyl futalosine synthase
VGEAPGGRGHVHRGPQHQLHERLRGGLRVLRLRAAPKHGEGYTLSFEQIGEKIEETKALGGVQILIQGGHNPYIPFEWYLDLLRYIKTYHPIHIHGFSPSEVDFFAKLFRLDARTVIRELQKAGLDSIPGGGGEILVQRVRDYAAPKKAGADRWLEIMEIAHEEGMKTSSP